MRAHSWISFAFIGLLNASPLHPVTKRASGEPVIVGYRRTDNNAVSSYQAAGGALTPQPAGTDSINQIGPGVYLSLKPGEWDEGDWDCTVTANADAWNAVNKAWVPQEDGACGQPLWNDEDSDDEDADPNGAANIPQYLTNLVPGGGWTVQNTILYSYILYYQPGNSEGLPVKTQLLIPNSLIGSGSPLDLKVSCIPTNSPLEANFQNLPPIDLQGLSNLRGDFPPA